MAATPLDLATLPPTFRLRNGVEMPRCGLGTFRAAGPDLQTAILHAVRNCGIRHIDTATIYKNMRDVRTALDGSDVPRSEIFITSKVSPYEMGSEKAAAAVERILEDLGSVDLILIHWPGKARVDASSPKHRTFRQETWRVLEEAYEGGRCRAIGVSNFTVAHLEDMAGWARIRPMVNQVEVHPRYAQAELLEYCEKHGIAVVAYASFGQGGLLAEPALAAVAARHPGKSPAQCLLRWALEKGVLVIPKSTRPERIDEWRLEALLGGWGSGLTEFDWAELEELGREPKKYCWDPKGFA